LDFDFEKRKGETPQERPGKVEKKKPRTTNNKERSASQGARANRVSRSNACELESIGQTAAPSASRLSITECKTNTMGKIKGGESQNVPTGVVIDVRRHELFGILQVPQAGSKGRNTEDLGRGFVWLGCFLVRGATARSKPPQSNHPPTNPPPPQPSKKGTI